MKREKGNWGWTCYLALAVLLLGFWGRAEVPEVCATDLMMPVAPSSDKLDINVKASPIRYGQRLDQSVLAGSAVYSGDQPQEELFGEEETEEESDGEGKDGGGETTPRFVAGMAVPGTFSWVNPQEVMFKVGVVQQNYVFTPSSALMEPVTTGVTGVQVDPGLTSIAQLPASILETTFYHGDVLGQTAALRGGQAVVHLETAPPQDEPVAGRFSWQDPLQVLTVGKQTVKLNFTPFDLEKYLPCSVDVQIDVLPRPVSLTLGIDRDLVLSGEEITLTAFAPKDEKTASLNGSVFFYNGTECIAGPVLFSDSGTGFLARIQWPVPSAGAYSLQAVYEPGDEATARAESNVCSVRAETPVSSLMPEVLPKAVLGEPYRAAFETDASGSFPLTFSVTGRLPAGLGLDNRTGVLEGTPSEAGTFAFTVQAAEGQRAATARREYELTVEPGEVQENQPSGEQEQSGQKDQSGQKEQSGQETQNSKEPESQEVPVKTPQEVEDEFWISVMFRIYKAQAKGDTVTVNATGHKSLPDKVLDALRHHQKVSLALIWEGGTILIPAGKAPDARRSSNTWTLSELAGSFALPAETIQQAAPEIPQIQIPEVQPQSPVPAGAANFADEVKTVRPYPEKEASPETESAMPETESAAPETEDIVPETPEVQTAAETLSGLQTAPETQDPSKSQQEPIRINWFLVAACVCALTGLAAILIAVAAVAQREDLEEGEDEEDSEEEDGEEEDGEE